MTGSPGEHSGPGGEGARNPYLLTEEWDSAQLEIYVDANPGRIFAIVDPAGEPSVWDKVDELGHERCLSLFNGYAAIKYKKIAPYIFSVDAALLAWLRESFGDKPWGIFVESAFDLAEIRRHCHTLLMARQPDGESVYLRFYDPRITPGFVQCCNEQELSQIFKDKIEALIVEQQGPNQQRVQVIRKIR